MAFLAPLLTNPAFLTLGAGMLGSMFGNRPQSFEYQSDMSPEQQKMLAGMFTQLQGGQGQGGLADVAKYYQGILGNDPSAMEMYDAPLKRQFEREIIPGLSAQFAGMGSGMGSSSAFRNAAVQAGGDLQQRLAEMRAQMRGNAAQSLQNLALGKYGQVYDIAAEAGPIAQLMQSLAPGIGKGIGQKLGGSLSKSIFGDM